MKQRRSVVGLRLAFIYDFNAYLIPLKLLYIVGDE